MLTSRLPRRRRPREYQDPRVGGTGSRSPCSARTHRARPRRTHAIPARVLECSSVLGETTTDALRRCNLFTDQVTPVTISVTDADLQARVHFQEEEFPGCIDQKFPVPAQRSRKTWPLRWRTRHLGTKCIVRRAERLPPPPFGDGVESCTPVQTGEPHCRGCRTRPGFRCGEAVEPSAQ